MTTGDADRDLMVRAATAGDVEAIARIERASFTDPWSARSFRQYLHRNEVVFDVAVTHEVEARVVGFTVAYVFDDQAEVANLAVEPAERGCGIGRRLLAHVLATVRARGARDVFLEVRESNVAARALYLAQGFTAVGRRARYYVDPVEDALVLRAVVA